MKLKMSNEVDLGREPVRHLLFVLAVPAITSQVVNALYNMVDNRYTYSIPETGAASLTGVGVCFPLIMIVFCLCLASGNGRRSKGQYPDGQKRQSGAEKIMGNCFFRPGNRRSAANDIDPDLSASAALSLWSQ